jgi:thiamine biosynthesis protein ThiS
MSLDITITVNGENRACPVGTSISSLLETMSLKPEKVAVELNRRLVRSAQYATELKGGDQVEIVTFVGGG